VPASYHALITVHLLAALVWLGGMFFLGLVGAPVLRALEPPQLRQRIFAELGARFRTVGWVAIAVLVTTGTLMLQARGLLRWSGVLDSPAFWGSTTGLALMAKLATVTVMVAASAVHDFIDGPAASAATVGSPQAARLRRRASILARVNAGVGILLVIAAVRLARG
jgi:copper resistance protein D